MLAFNQQPYDQTHFLDLLRRLLPEDYVQSLQAGQGYDVAQAMAQVGARVSLGITRLEQGDLALYAAGGSKATASVSFARPDHTTGALTIKAGTVVTTSIGGRSFVTTQDVTFGALDLIQNASVEAVATGWEWNVRGPFTTAGNELVPGMIDTIKSLVTAPAYADPRFIVSQVSAATGGAAAMLDGLAGDHLLSRGPTEGDDSLSLRIRTLPDTVSPGAVKRLLASIFDPLGIAFDFIETFEHRYQECWDAPSPNAGTPTYEATPPTNPDYNDKTFAFDDPRTDDPFMNRWLGFDDYRAAFIVAVPRDVTLRDVGLAYDDPGSVTTDWHPVAGKPWRQTPAYDCVSTDDPTMVFGPAYDGWDAARGALYASAFQQLDRVRAAGVNVFLVGIGSVTGIVAFDTDPLPIFL